MADVSKLIERASKNAKTLDDFAFVGMLYQVQHDALILISWDLHKYVSVVPKRADCGELVDLRRVGHTGLAFYRIYKGE